MKSNTLIATAIAITLILALQHPASGAPKPAAKKRDSSSPATVASSQAEAIKKYPDLAKAGSALNQEFVARFQRYQTEKPDFFKDVAWPLKLANEVADFVTVVPAGPDGFRLDHVFDRSLADIERVLGEPVGKEEEDPYGEWIEYRPPGFDYVKVLLKRKMVKIKAPGFTGDNIATSWEKLLAKVGVSTEGIAPQVGGYRDRLFKFYDARVGRLILTGDRATMNERNPFFQNYFPYALFFHKDTNDLTIWGGN